MRIETVLVKNLRSVRDVSLTVEPLTALIGGNNAGKSTILKAIEMFFEAAPKFTSEDFSKGTEDQPIEITIGFDELTPKEIVEFGNAVIDGKLTVTRHLSLEEDERGQYSAQALVCPKFSEVRDETNGTTKRTLYNSLADGIDGLERVSSHTEVSEALSEWERLNPGECESVRVRGFFGATNVANGKLRIKTSLHLVPAVRDAAEDASDARRSPIISLLGEISKQTFENREGLTEFIDQTQKKFDELTDPSTVPELAGISELLTESVQHFYADSKLKALWTKGDGISVTYRYLPRDGTCLVEPVRADVRGRD